MAAAPNTAPTAKMRLAGNRSASPESEIASVPAMKPSCTALVSAPTSATPIPQSRASWSATPLALNQSTVPSSSAMTIQAMAVFVRIPHCERHALELQSRSRGRTLAP